MRCLYCGKRLSLLRKLSGKDFCNEEHFELYMQDQESLGLARLIEAKQQTKAQKKRRSRSGEGAGAEQGRPPFAGFVTQAPTRPVNVRPRFATSRRFQQLEASRLVALPQVDMSPARCAVPEGRTEVPPPAISVLPRIAPLPDATILDAPLELKFPIAPVPEAPDAGDPPRPGPSPLLAPDPKPPSPAPSTIESYPPQMAVSPWLPRESVSVRTELASAGHQSLTVASRAGSQGPALAPAPSGFNLAVRVPDGRQAPPQRAAEVDAGALHGLEEVVAGFRMLALPVAAGPGARTPAEAEEVSQPVPVCHGASGQDTAALHADCHLQRDRKVDFELGAASAVSAKRGISAEPELEAPAPSSPRLLSTPEASLPVVDNMRECSLRPSAGYAPAPATVPSAEPTARFLLPPNSGATAGSGGHQLPAATLVLPALPNLATRSQPATVMPEPLDSNPSAFPAVPPAASSPVAAGVPDSAGLRATPFPPDREMSAPVSLPEPWSMEEREFAPGMDALACGAESGDADAAPSRIVDSLLPLPPPESVGAANNASAKSDLAVTGMAPAPMTPRLRAAPARDDVGSVKTEKKHGPPVWQRLATPALGALRSVPSGPRWLLMALPLFGLLLWHTMNREQTVIADTSEPETISALKARWGVFQENISSRAAISLSDDFRGGLADWTGEEGWSRTWAYDESGFIRPGKMAVYRPSISLADYQFEFASVIERGGVNWIYRASDTKNYYAGRLFISEPGPIPKGSIDWYAVVDGKKGRTVRTELPFSLRNEKMYRIRVVTRGDSLTTFVDDRVASFIQDDRLATGGVGFFKRPNDRVRLRWISVIHQYDMLGRLCALIAPYSFENTPRSVSP